MSERFLLTNTASGDGLYRKDGVDHILKAGEQVVLDFPPEFRSAELKLFPVKQ